MKTRRNCMAWRMIPPAVLMLTLSFSAIAKEFTITTIDPPGSGVASGYGAEGIVINSSGAIAGFYVGSSNVFHAYVREADGTLVTFDAPGAPSTADGPPPIGTSAGTGQGTYAPAMDDSGAIAGYVIDATGVAHSYLRAPDGTMTLFDVPGAGAESGQGTMAGNMGAGVITGNYVDANGMSHGFLRTPDGKITTFDVPDAGTGAGQGTMLGWAQCINPAGTINGYYIDANGVGHGYLRAADGAMTTLDAPGAGYGSGQGTWTWSINTAGAVTGAFQDANGVYHAVLREPDGRFINFDVPGAGTASGQGTQGEGIDPAGAIVGLFIDASGVSHGFVRAHSGVITEFDVPGAGTGSGQGTFPMTNNSSGAITGFYADSNGVYHGFVLK
jgi:hypothetical protein